MSPSLWHETRNDQMQGQQCTLGRRCQREQEEKCLRKLYPVPDAIEEEVFGVPHPNPKQAHQ